MAEAGFPNGFAVDWLTPVPNYYSRGERIVSQLQAIGVRAKLQTIERGVFLKRLQGGLKEWPGVQIILNAARVGGTWSNWYDSFMKCGGFNGKDRNCVPEIDDKFNKYLASVDAGDRAARQGGEMAGRVSDDHDCLRLSLGRHRAQRLIDYVRQAPVPLHRPRIRAARGPRINSGRYLWQTWIPACAGMTRITLRQTCDPVG